MIEKQIYAKKQIIWNSGIILKNHGMLVIDEFSGIPLYLGCVAL